MVLLPLTTLFIETAMMFLVEVVVIFFNIISLCRFNLYLLSLSDDDDHCQCCHHLYHLYYDQDYYSRLLVPYSECLIL